MSDMFLCLPHDETGPAMQYIFPNPEEPETREAMWRITKTSRQSHEDINKLGGSDEKEH